MYIITASIKISGSDSARLRIKGGTRVRLCGSREGHMVALA